MPDTETLQQTFWQRWGPTLLPLLFSALASLVGWVYFYAQADARSQAQEKQIQELQQERGISREEFDAKWEAVRQDLREIKEDVRELRRK